MGTHEDKEEALLLPAAAKLDAAEEALAATEEALDEAYTAAPGRYSVSYISSKTFSQDVLEADLLATLAALEAEGEPCLDA